ncbi:MAG: hypothetical protein ACR5LA_13840, partial [Wolbachia sp.]
SNGMAMRTYKATGEALLIPRRNTLEQGKPYNYELGNGTKDERVADGCVVVKKWGNAHGAKTPY